MMMTGRHTERRKKPRRGIPNRVRTGIICVVTAVWGVNFMAPIFMHGYTPAPEINLAFMGIVGILVASYRDEGDDDS